jgi:nucleotide-binding universal stress UspA family protein
MGPQIESAPLTFKTVIFATDFSACTENAGQYASMLARKFAAELLVAHAFVLSQAALEAEAEGGQAAKSLQRKEIETALTEAANRLGGGARWTATALLEGDPRERIPQLALENADSIVVMGTRGRGRLERGIIGSVAERILRANTGHSLTVGPLVPSLESGSSPFKRVLYATSLSPESARGAKYAIEFAKAFQANMEVLHIAKAEEMESPAKFSEIQEQFRAIIDRIAPEHTENLCNPKSVIDSGTAHERILEHIRESSADLLVLSIHKSSNLWLQARLSGAFHIIANATCPVLTITG